MNKRMILRTIAVIALKVIVISGAFLSVNGFMIMGIEDDMHYKIWIAVLASIGSIAAIVSASMIDKINNKRKLRKNIESK